MLNPSYRECWHEFVLSFQLISSFILNQSSRVYNTVAFRSTTILAGSISYDHWPFFPTADFFFEVRDFLVLPVAEPRFVSATHLRLGKQLSHQLPIWIWNQNTIWRLKSFHYLGLTITAFNQDQMTVSSYNSPVRYDHTNVQPCKLTCIQLNFNVLLEPES